MKVLILYKSVHGTTKDYAMWIHKQLSSSDIFFVDDFDTSLFANYDKVILGSSTYMGRISILEYLKKNWKQIQKKNVFLFSVGLIDAEEDASKKAFEMIPEDIRSQINYIKLPGRISIDKLRFFQRSIVKLTGIKQSVDKFDTSKAQPIIKFAKESS